MKAIKENKEYTINSDAKAAYQEAGYDIFDDNGKMIARGRGKNVSAELYEKALEENEKLKKELAAVKKELAAVKKEASEKSKEKAVKEKAGD